MTRQIVRVNVYDMYWLNEYASPLGVGVYHAGIEVYGVEYAYGGHSFAFSGIFELTPRSAEELGDNFRFRESIVLGETNYTSTQIRDIVKTMGREYGGDRYHLINKNCNHFSAAFAKRLTGKDIPPWINRLANLSASVPFINRMLPTEWLTPTVLQQNLDSEANAARRSSNTAGPLNLHHNPSVMKVAPARPQSSPASKANGSFSNSSGGSGAKATTHQIISASAQASPTAIRPSTATTSHNGNVERRNSAREDASRKSWQ